MSIIWWTWLLLRRSKEDKKDEVLRFNILLMRRHLEGENELGARHERRDGFFRASMINHQEDHSGIAKRNMRSCYLARDPSWCKSCKKAPLISSWCKEHSWSPLMFMIASQILFLRDHSLHEHGNHWRLFIEKHFETSSPHVVSSGWFNFSNPLLDDD